MDASEPDTSLNDTLTNQGRFPKNNLPLGSFEKWFSAIACLGKAGGAQQLTAMQVHRKDSSHLRPFNPSSGTGPGYLSIMPSICLRMSWARRRERA